MDRLQLLNIVFSNPVRSWLIRRMSPGCTTVLTNKSSLSNIMWANFGLGWEGVCCEGECCIPTMSGLFRLSISSFIPGSWGEEGLASKLSPAAVWWLADMAGWRTVFKVINVWWIYSLGSQLDLEQAPLGCLEFQAELGLREAFWLSLQWWRWGTRVPIFVNGTDEASPFPDVEGRVSPGFSFLVNQWRLRCYTYWYFLALRNSHACSWWKMYTYKPKQCR